MESSETVLALAEQIRSEKEESAARAILGKLAKSFEREQASILNNIGVSQRDVDACTQRVWERAFRNLRNLQQEMKDPFTVDSLLDMVKYEAMDEWAIRLVGQVRESTGKHEKALNDLLTLFDKPFRICVKLAMLRRGVGDLDRVVEEVLQNVRIAVFEGVLKSPADGGYDPKKGKFYTYVKETIIKYRVLRGSQEEENKGEPSNRGVSLNAPGGQKIASPGISGATSRVELIELKLKAYEELFRLVFSDRGGYPHQQLTFGFSKLIYSKTGSRGDSKTMDALHGSTLLHPLALDFWNAYLSSDRNLQEDDSMRDRFESYLEPLRERLVLVVEFMLEAQGDDSSLRTYKEENPALLGCEVGETCIRDYYGSRDYAACIPDWCYKVRQRVRGKVIMTPTD